MMMTRWLSKTAHEDKDCSFNSHVGRAALFAAAASQN